MSSIMSLLLAFDISTTVIGYSIFDLETKNLVEIKYYTFEGDDLVARGFELKNLIDFITGKYQIKHFAIEERLKSFRQGGTNADAMLKTAQMNFLCQFLMIDKNIEVKELNVNSARSACFPKFHTLARSIKNKKHKEIAFDMVVEVLGQEIFPKKILKSGPRKGQEVFIDEAGDMADSWVIGKAFFALNEKPEPSKKKRK